MRTRFTRPSRARARKPTSVATAGGYPEERSEDFHPAECNEDVYPEERSEDFHPAEHSEDVYPAECSEDVVVVVAVHPTEQREGAATAAAPSNYPCLSTYYRDKITCLDTTSSRVRMRMP